MSPIPPSALSPLWRLRIRVVQEQCSGSVCVAPGQGHAGSTVTVVVHTERVSDPLWLQARGWPSWVQTHRLRSARTETRAVSDERHLARELVEQSHAALFDPAAGGREWLGEVLEVDRHVDQRHVGPERTIEAPGTSSSAH